MAKNKSGGDRVIMSTIEENLNNVLTRIDAAAKRAGKNAKDITLIAVTKTHGADLINEAITLGVKDIGENRPQEIRDKFDDILPVRIHQIGQLQTNKIKYIIDKVSLIHSVDSIKLMSEIDKSAKKHNLVMDILIQVNISGEETKSGIAPHELDEVLKFTSECENIRVKGLMTIAPKGEAQEARVHFENMNELYLKYQQKTYKNVSLEILSMGMSSDFEVAIECGSNMVRVGSAIFGKRHYAI